jgi:hypothetical protein
VPWFISPPPHIDLLMLNPNPMVEDVDSLIACLNLEKNFICACELNLTMVKVIAVERV